MSGMDDGFREGGAAERRLAELLSTVRQDAPAPPWLRQRVMAEIQAAPDPFWRRVVVWFLRPRSVRLSPAAGLGFAVAASLLLLALPGDRGPGAGGDVAQLAPEVVTRFVFVAPGASSVHVTGDFLDWSESGVALADPLGNGVWTVDLPLDPGVYQYSFVVDGVEWRPDPLAVSQVDDGFGRQNSVVIVTRET